MNYFISVLSVVALPASQPNVEQKPISPMLSQSVQQSSGTAPAPPPPTDVEIKQVDENAVRQANDGFGTSIGRETIGIYNSSNVRGFSPTRAGNVRINGLYYDQVQAPGTRIRQSSTVKVGLSTLSSPFPAPSGLVDYTLREPGTNWALSATASINDWAGKSLEIDVTAPINQNSLAIRAGFGLYRNELANGSDSLQHVEGLLLRWRPSPDVEIVPFWQQSDVYDDQVSPVYIPAGDFLPMRINRRRYYGPDWTTYAGKTSLYGALGRFDIAEGWMLNVGVFRSFFRNAPDHFTFLENINTQGLGRYTVLALPPASLSSTSGELRLTGDWNDGPRRHRVIFSVSGRDRHRRFDGSTKLDFGNLSINTDINPLEPSSIPYGPQSVDIVRQLNLGLAYQGRWLDVGELSASISRAHYYKDFTRPGIASVETRAEPILYNGTLAIEASKKMIFYAGASRGLEESGIAPQSAANRNEPLPAIITKQFEAGLQLGLPRNLRLIAGLFELSRPYFTTDGSNIFRELGRVRNRGVEGSVSGPLTPNVDLVMGAALLNPRVTGDAFAVGRVGARPIDIPRVQVDLNVDWRLPFVRGLSLDGSINYVAKRPATTLNTVYLPARERLNIGTRYRFRLAEQSAVLRLSISNVFNTYGYDLRGAGAYEFIAGRSIQAYLTVDF